MVGVKAFLIVFLLMPMGHALMILMNKYMGDYLAWGALGITVLGLGVLGLTRFTRSSQWQSFYGCFAGVLLWTGAVEYGLYFGAIALGVERVGQTAGEYRLMLHTWSFLVLLVLYLLLHEGVRCNLFIWLRRKLRLTRGSAVNGTVTNYGPRTAFEMITILWFFYVLLLVLYDLPALGEHHPLTYACLFLSLGGGLWLAWRLVQIRDLGYAIRYAIPTVIVLWNVFEILARWEVFTEPWIVINVPIMLTICISFVCGMVLVLRDLKTLRSGGAYARPEEKHAV